MRHLLTPPLASPHQTRLALLVSFTILLGLSFPLSQWMTASLPEQVTYPFALIGLLAGSLVTHLMHCWLDRGVGQRLQQLSQQQQSLLRSVEIWQGVIEAIPMAIFWKDRQSVYMGANQQAVKASGLCCVSEMLGKTDLQLQWPTFQAELFHALDQQVMQSETPVYQQVQQIHSGTGEVSWISVNKIPLRNEQGAVIGVVGACNDITTHKETQAALGQRTSWLQMALDAARMGAWDWHIPSQEEQWSPETRLLFGLDPDAPLTYHHFLNCVHPEDRERVQQAQQSTLHQGSPYYVEYRITLPNGQIRWLASSGRCLRDAAGQPLRLIGICMDITDRKQIEQERETSLSLLQATLESTADGILVANRDRCITLHNQQFLEMWGIPPTLLEPGTADARLEFMGSRTLNPEEFHQQVRHLFLQPEQRQKDYLYLKDGRVFERYSLPQRIGNQIVGRVWSYRDITEQQRAQEALRESQAMLKLVFDSIPLTIYWKDTQLIYRGCNHLCALEAGLDSPDQIVGKTDAQLWSAEQAARFRQTDQQVLSSGMSYFQSQSAMQLADGRTIWISSNKICLRDPDGKISGILGCHEDITQLKRVEEALRTSQQALHQQLQRTLLIKKITEEIRSSLDSQQIVQGTALELGQALHVEACLVHTYLPQPLPHLHLTGHYFAASPPPLDGLRDLPIVEGSHLHETFNHDRAFAYTEGEVTKAEAIGSHHVLVNLYQQMGVKSLLMVRTSCQGEVNGVISLLDYQQTRQWTEMEIELLESIAIQVGIGLGHARLLQQERYQREQLENQNALLRRIKQALNQSQTALQYELQRTLLLSQITQEIRSSLDAQRIFQVMAAQLGQALKVQRCRVYAFLAQPQPSLLTMAVYASPGYEHKGVGDVPFAQDRHAQLVLSQDQAVASPNVYEDPLLPPVHEQAERVGIKSLLAVRTSYQGEANGLIVAGDYQRFREWTKEEVALLEAVAAQGGIALAQARLLEQERQQRQQLSVQNMALDQAKQAAEAANLAKSTFLSTMSHELRTPLNAILGFAQVMAKDPYLTDQQREQLSIINRSGEHLLTLINDVLEISKMEAGKVTVRSEVFHLPRLLQDLKFLLGQRATSKGLAFQVCGLAELPEWVFGDGGKLRQVLTNLLSNAIKFTEMGRVELWLSYEAEILTCSVEDTGIGITAEEQQYLFHPFVQTESGMQAQGGTGLGLALSRQYIELMGGKIQVLSRVNQGSTFSFWIPLPRAESPILVASQSQPIIGLAPAQPDYRVLLVDDQPENCLLLAQLLQPIGFITRSVTSGAEALDVWHHWDPHLICVDIQMPGMDGRSLIRQIRQSKGGGSVVILAVSALALADEQQALLDLGCQAVLAKPLQESALFQAIQEHLGVIYLYAEGGLPTSESAASEQSSDLAAALKMMPSTWLADLHQATLRADSPAVLELVAQMQPEQQELAEALRAWIHDFQFEPILALTQENTP
ncbi:MAG: PAS domain-containing protein [Cyanobacteriota bacterium]|nr:PAS domain-containing protein [Cyanobacteriota bacterium]